MKSKVGEIHGVVEQWCKFYSQNNSDQQGLIPANTEQEMLYFLTFNAVISFLGTLKCNILFTFILEVLSSVTQLFVNKSNIIYDKLVAFLSKFKQSYTVSSLKQQDIFF